MFDSLNQGFQLDKLLSRLRHHGDRVDEELNIFCDFVASFHYELKDRREHEIDQFVTDEHQPAFDIPAVHMEKPDLREVRELVLNLIVEGQVPINLGHEFVRVDIEFGPLLLLLLLLL